MNQQNLINGVELDTDFAGFPVFLIKHEGSYYVECKKVLFSYDDYLLYLEDMKQDTLGYNLQGKPCQISSFNGLTVIGCLKDTNEKFKSIIKQVKTIIRHDNKAK